MSLRRITALFLRQVFLIAKNKVRIIGIFYWSLLDLLVWGFMTVYFNDITGASIAVSLLAAAVLWNFFVRVQQGILVSFLEDVWSRNFINLFASPLSIGEYIAGNIITGLAQSLLVLAALFILAWLLFAYNIFTLGLVLIPYIAILFVFGIAMGITTVSLVLRFGPASEWFGWWLPFVFMPVSAVFYPVSSLPSWLQPFAFITPPAYVFEGMRAILAGASPAANGLLLGFLTAFGYLALAAFLLWHVYRRVLRTGSLARFSAEIG